MSACAVKASFASFPGAPLGQAGLGVGGARVRVVAPPLAFEVAPGGPASAGAALVARAEALLPGPGLDERAVDAEVLIAEQLAAAGLGQHGREEGGGDLAAEEPLAVLGEDGDVPDRVVRIKADEPAEEQVVVELFHQQALRADRVEGLQQQRPQQLLGRDAGPAHLAVQPVEQRRELGQGPVGHLVHRPQGMVLGHALLRGHVAPLSVLPRVVTTHRAPPRRDDPVEVQDRDRRAEVKILTASPSRFSAPS